MEMRSCARAGPASSADKPAAASNLKNVILESSLARLLVELFGGLPGVGRKAAEAGVARLHDLVDGDLSVVAVDGAFREARDALGIDEGVVEGAEQKLAATDEPLARSEEPTSELQSKMRISYAAFCLKKKTH